MGYQIIRALLYFFFSLYRLHVEGRENIPDKGAVIAAANHKSYFLWEWRWRREESVSRLNRSSSEILFLAG